VQHRLGRIQAAVSNSAALLLLLGAMHFTGCELYMQLWGFACL